MDTTLVSTVPAEIRWVEPERLRPNPWNPNVMDSEMLEKARASIREFGFIDPITVRGLEIIDGEHRWLIAREMELGVVPVIDVGPIPDAIAQQLTIVLNETRGQADPNRLGRLLKELMVTETKEHLLATLPFTAQALERLTGLPTMTWEGLDRPQTPTLPGHKPQAWVERTYRMPKDSAEVIDQAIARVREKADDDVSDWQALEYVCADFLSS